MRLNTPYNINSHRIRWDFYGSRLLDYRDWGYVTKEGMVVLTAQPARNPDMRRILTHDLGMHVFNGCDRPPGLEAWDEQGHPVRWNQLAHVWMLWDEEHNIILPQPAWRAPIVYPHYTAQPHVLVTRSGYPAGFTLSKANRRRGDGWMEFFKLIVMKGRMAGAPSMPRTLTKAEICDILSCSPKLEMVSVEDCQRIVLKYSLHNENAIRSSVLDMVRELSRDRWHTRYLSTWSKGRTP